LTIDAVKSKGLQKTRNTKAQDITAKDEKATGRRKFVKKKQRTSKAMPGEGVHALPGQQHCDKTLKPPKDGVEKSSKIFCCVKSSNLRVFSGLPMKKTPKLGAMA